jgi:hypothetical protein
MLRFAKDPRTEAGLKEFIADAEERRDALEKMRRRAARSRLTLPLRTRIL